MRKGLLLLLLCLTGWMDTVAQRPDDEYYPYAVPEERIPLLSPDSSLFYRAVQLPADDYGRLAGFILPQVAIRRRGQSYDRQRISLEGIPVDYRHTAGLRLLGAEEAAATVAASSDDAVGTTGGLRRFRFAEGEPLRPYRAAVRFSDRNYLFGARFSACRRVGREWSLSVGCDLKTGRDMHVEGVFTDGVTVALRTEKRWRTGMRFAATVLVPFEMRGTRLSSVEEAFALTGDRYYNPAWGLQDGKVRNSRVRRDAVPLLAVWWDRPLSAATAVEIRLGVKGGVRKYSALGWYDARTPMPDNYRYLPSYTGDRATAEAWRGGDFRYTQIDWDGLIACNRMRGGDAAYALEDRVERVGDLHFAVMFATEADRRLVFRYGVRFDRRSTRNCKRMRDLLGADRLVDIDQYLVDDDAYGNLLQNDLRHPDRTVGRGDRFGYDYALATQETSLRFRTEYRADRLRLDVGLSLGDAGICRRGYFEKELFPGDRSYGRSRRLKFTPYAFDLCAGWAFSPRSYLELVAMSAAVVPDAADCFVQPLYNNRTVDGLSSERIYAAEANCRLTGPRWTLALSAFAAANFDGTETRRYYDDMAGLYCDMAVTGIATAAYGVEAAATVRFSSQWSLSAAASVGRYRYIRDPQVTVLSDADNSAVDTRAPSHLGGCETGGAPRLTGCAQVAWFGRRGWGARFSAGYVAGRYVAPSFLRRTARIARQGGTTPEAFEAFMRQERLGDAFTADASFFKSFRFGRSRLTASVVLRNLTGEQPLYDGFEALRVRRIRSGAQSRWEPQSTRYTYAYPRSFFFSVACEF